jgi:hypothetical protein
MRMDSRDRVAARAEQPDGVVTTRKGTRKRRGSSTPTTEFGRTLKDLFGKTANPGEVNEEELFAAAAHQLVKNKFGAQSAEDFKSAFRLNMVDKPKTERFSSPERAAKETLKFFVKATLLTKEEAKSIRSIAFEVAQLDDNKGKVWDSWGETRAVTSFRRGQELVQSRLEASGNAPVAPAAESRAKMARYGGEQPRTESSTRTGGGRSRRGKITQEA